MARSSVRTLLPLDRFTRLVSYSPILFNQVFVPPLDGEDRQSAVSCSDPILQYTWQPRGGGRPGRDEIAESIAQAEELIMQAVKFSPVPQWFANDTVLPIRVPRAGLWSYAPAPWLLNVRASNNYVIEGGVEAWTAISLAQPIVYSDADGDGYFETATVTVATTVTDVNEIAVYYPGESHDPAWEVRPIKVVISGGNAIITFERQQVVKPDLLERLDANAVDGTDDDNFLETVDVYRHYSDPSQMAIVEWTPGICNADACIVETDTGCFSQVNERNGIVNVHAATWDEDVYTWQHNCCSWWRQPTRVRLWYRAGYRDNRRSRPMHDMAPDLERAITYLALSLMDRTWEACEQIRNMQAHWREDLAQRQSSPGSSSSFQLSPRLLDNPFGTTRAAIYAWRVVQPLIVGEALVGE